MSTGDPNTGRSRGLGKGLATLLGESQPEQGEVAVATPLPTERRLPIERLKASPLQPRSRFDEAELEGLAASIRANGVIQPLLVRPAPQDEGQYEIIAGERRWRAAQLAGQHDLPVVIRHITDEEALELALVENLQREDLSPLEEAQAYHQLVIEFGHTQDEVAHALGKSRSHVANMIRLLELPETVKAMLDEGTLSAGHARALLNAANAELLAQQVLKRGLNVRQTEALVRRAARKPSAKPGGAARKDPNARDMEEDLTRRWGYKVEIERKGEAGRLIVHYRTLEQLDDFVRRVR